MWLHIILSFVYVHTFSLSLILLSSTKCHFPRIEMLGSPTGGIEPHSVGASRAFTPGPPCRAGREGTHICMQMNTSTACLVNIHCVTVITASPTLLPGVYIHDSPRKTRSCPSFLSRFFPTGIWLSPAPQRVHVWAAGATGWHEGGHSHATQRWNPRPDAWKANHKAAFFSQASVPAPLRSVSFWWKWWPRNAYVNHFLPRPTLPWWWPQGQPSQQQSGPSQALMPESGVGSTRCAHSCCSHGSRSSRERHRGAHRPSQAMPYPTDTWVKSKTSFKDQT